MSALTVNDLVSLAQRDYVLRGCGCSATWPYQSKPLLRLLGAFKAKRITAETIEDYKARRILEGAAPATVNRELDGLSRGLTIAADMGLLVKKHKLQIRRFRLENAREGFVEIAEFERITARLNSLVRDIAIFAYWTGWRRGEILRLSWLSVVPGRWARIYDRKSRTWKSAVLCGPVQEVIERWAAGRAHGGELVFHRDGNPVRCFRKSWATAVRRAGIERRVLFHDLRRSFINNGRRAGIDRKILMEMTGHKTHSVFDRYQFIDEEEHRKAALRIQRGHSRHP